MAIMRRVSRAEAAKALGVSENVISERIASGSLVACQEPAHRDKVWLRSEVKPAPTRKLRDISTSPRKKVARQESAHTEPFKEATFQPSPESAATAAATPIPDFTAELQELREAVTRLKQDLAQRESEIDQQKAALETSQREIQRLLMALERLESAADTSPVLKPKETDLPQNDKPEASNSPSVSTLNAAPDQTEIASGSGDNPHQKPFLKSFQSSINTLRLILSVPQDLKIRKRIGRTWLKFSPPMLS